MAKSAAALGFEQEHSARQLQHRCVMAALRELRRRGAVGHEPLVNDWLDDHDAVMAFDFDRLPNDAPMDELDAAAAAQIDELLDDRLPLPDEGWELGWRRCGLRFRTHITGTENDVTDLLVSRLTAGGRDRWFHFWGGSFQGEIYEMSEPTAATRAERAHVILDWLDWALDHFERLATIDIHAEKATARRARALLRVRAPHLMPGDSSD